MIRIGIVATSSVVPKIELEIGLNFLKKEGFEIESHPSVLREYYFYPAPDADRAKALIEFSKRDDLDAIWCARGGYGATHLLPYLDRAKKMLQGKKKKTLLGYSDATALLEWFRVNLGWKVIHSPMPALRTFSVLKPEEWVTLKSLLENATHRKLGDKKKVAHYQYLLTPLFLPKKFSKIEAPLVGGNLCVWNSLLGTKNAGIARGKILFLEELQENHARINRMIHHLEQASGLKGVKALILGDFLDCNDSVADCLKEEVPTLVNLETYLKNPPKEALKPMRELLTNEKALDFIFHGLGERNAIPVFKGVPAGHGPNRHSLYLGQKHLLQKNGRFQLVIP